MGRFLEVLSPVGKKEIAPDDTIALPIEACTFEGSITTEHNDNLIISGLLERHACDVVEMAISVVAAGIGGVLPTINQGTAANL